jgi:2,4-dienoyl-CoA reductase-like NADH-dependent reductase (Old Yellow Enzyme family)
MGARLFDPLKIRDIKFRNRIVVSPMCMYSSKDGYANEWHVVHLASRAVGGSALVMTEAAAVEPRGRISPVDLGIYKDEHVEKLAEINGLIKSNGAVPGIQLAHAGRKAGTPPPWVGGGPLTPEQRGWPEIVAPSALPFTDGYCTPKALSVAEIAQVVNSFAQAAKRSLDAGFEVIELHGAHGYLIHQFLSPVSNHRTDEYGGSFESRTRFAKDIAKAVRKVWPERLPLFFRFSCTDWIAEGGWDIEQSIELAKQVKDLGVDLIDCSSGGNLATATIPLGPGYQTPFAERIRKESGILTGAVGMITSPVQADHIIGTGQADMVILARELLRDPYWPRRAAKELGHELSGPPQYARAW